MMLPPTMVWRLAPMFPINERDRTMIPRTTPMFLRTLYPGNSNVVVVKGCVLVIASHHSTLPAHAEKAETADQPRTAEGTRVDAYNTVDPNQSSGPASYTFALHCSFGTVAVDYDKRAVRYLGTIQGLLPGVSLRSIELGSQPHRVARRFLCADARPYRESV